VSTDLERHHDRWNQIVKNDNLLQADNITKSYDGVRALKNVCFGLRPGEVHALVGENGAGKSTLVKIITGAVQPDNGSIVLDGRLITANSPQVAKSLGISAIYQQPRIFGELTVAENIALGFEETRPWRRVDWNARYRRTEELLKRVGAQIDLDVDAAGLRMAEQQLVEIARALGSNAKILILDEPTACLSQNETEILFAVLRGLRTQGVGIIYISHRLEELSAIADRVTVLRDGAAVANRFMAETGREELIRLMVGRELSAIFSKRNVALGNVVLELKGFKRPGARSGVNLSLRAGEILGLAGLIGAGRSSLAKSVFGLMRSEAGEILLHGKPICIRAATDAIRHGIAYLPEDRRRHGIIPEMAVDANISLASLRSFVRHGAIDFRKERETASAYVQRFAIKTATLFSAVATLSGGNQQKVALSRWLETKPQVLILDEPTQGVDVGAKTEIHALMGNLAAQGMAILMISSELPELLGMCDRIAVMRSGEITGVLDRAEATQEAILALALGHGASVAATPTASAGVPG
jgi:rhamnose transport system ATP-binding protein